MSGFNSSSWDISLKIIINLRVMSLVKIMKDRYTESGTRIHSEKVTYFTFGIVTLPSGSHFKLKS